MLLLALCACGPKAVTLEEYYSRVVTLPNGQEIRAEEVTHPTDMMRGMMFRDHLAPDRGMLFMHDRPGYYTYWMYQVRIPLDIIWLDSNRTIVEIIENAAPCPGPASDCPSYGGNKQAQYVLELAGGMAQKYGLRLGHTLSF